MIAEDEPLGPPVRTAWRCVAFSALTLALGGLADLLA
jgi:hypothetical protein